ncbi:PREDICTED: aspartyl protease family protein 1-like [Nelumbo nucifera]|uniref:Aspartyl protease family protein 1-like n=2 Tax=Nelumbo nucifera TaxID=4432 RepID=A0A1U8AT65_NELNU|nr:PREDICTED: aspartyl protease family protein 1-like [Nelumbo nucifera]DAD41704.1 TPA_asm: hypothetical protein HUJ06_016027 [Nelumbo nucifera]
MASFSTCKFLLLLLLFLLIFALGSQTCHGFGTFGFDIHHRFSDAVKEILPVDDLPETGSLEYYSALTHRDRFIRGRGLASNDNQSLTFVNGNTTFRISSLGFLHYANVSLGTPSLSYLVALDTGSDLFWVPCDCVSCVDELIFRSSGTVLKFNIYSPNTSTTSKSISCNSGLCENARGCSGTPNSCPYEVVYLSNGTSSAGYLVEDVLHLTTDNTHPEVVDARITFGCGQVQTGSFSDGAAPNGLFGLGMDKLSVPSVLSSADLIANSFSMCFGPDGIGRISFGDKGSTDQEETPFNIHQSHPTYNISMTQLIIGKDAININFSAIFDSGTSFTYLNDPAYTHLTKSFDAQVQDKRHQSDSQTPFDYCYDTSLDVTSITPSTNIAIPNVTLTMKGGSQFPVFKPIVLVSSQNMVYYCLGVVKSSDVNIIGQNFMTGYRVVFDREKLVLGWRKSNCYDVEESNTSLANTRNSTVVPPAIAVEPGSFTPEATRNTGIGANTSGASPPIWSGALFLSLFSCAFLFHLPSFPIL